MERYEGSQTSEEQESIPGRGNSGEEGQLPEAGTCTLHLKQQNEGLGGWSPESTQRVSRVRELDRGRLTQDFVNQGKDWI